MQEKWLVFGRRTLGLIGIFACLWACLASKGADYLIEFLNKSLLRQTDLIGPVFGVFLWLLFSVKQKQTWQSPRWWSGLLTCLFLGSLVQALIVLALTPMSSASWALMETASALLLKLSVLLLAYGCLSLLLSAFAHSWTHYVPIRIIHLELGLSVLLFIVSTWIWTSIYMSRSSTEQPKETQTSGLASSLTPLDLKAEDIRGFLRLGSHLMIAAQEGLHHSYDGGKTWSLQTVVDGLLSDNIRAIYRVPEGLLLVFGSNRGWSTGNEGLMLSTNDGKTWTSVQLPNTTDTTRQDWSHLVCLETGYCAYASESNEIRVESYRSDLKNTQFFAQAVEGSGASLPILLAQDGDTIYRTERKLIWVSKDTGESWKEIHYSDEREQPTYRKSSHGSSKTFDDSFDFEYFGRKAEKKGRIHALIAKNSQIYLLLQGALLRSLDEGKTWDNIHAQHENYDSLVAADNAIYALSDDRLFRLSENRDRTELDESIQVSRIFASHGQLLIETYQGLFVTQAPTTQ